MGFILYIPQRLLTIDLEGGFSQTIPCPCPIIRGCPFFIIPVPGINLVNTFGVVSSYHQQSAEINGHQILAAVAQRYGVTTVSETKLSTRDIQDCPQ